MAPRRRKTNADLDALRLEVLKKHAAATKKISRLRRVNGVDIGRTEYDPRRNTLNLQRYTRKQLEAYNAQLTQFNSRAVGFVQGKGGVPIPSAQWREYKALERRYNAAGAKHNASVGNIKVPGSGQTIEQRAATLHPTANVDIGKMYVTINRTSTNIKSPAALTKLIKQMQKKTAADYVPKEVKKTRKAMSNLLKTVGLSDLQDKVNNLTDAQFNVLYQHTNFSTSIVNSYEYRKLLGTEAEQRWHSSLADTYRSNAEELIDWAGKLNVNDKRNTTQRKKR